MSPDIVLTNQRGIVVKVHKSSQTPYRREQYVYVTPMPFGVGRREFPTARSTGELFLNTQSNKMYVYDGSGWMKVEPGPDQ